MLIPQRQAYEGRHEHLGHDVEVAPRDAALGQGGSDHGLVAVELRAVDVPVSRGNRLLDDILGVLVRRVAGLRSQVLSDSLPRQER